MKEIILEKRYPHSREEDITDAFMRGYEIGKEQEHRWWSAFCANCKTEPNEPKTEPQHDYEPAEPFEWSEYIKDIEDEPQTDYRIADTIGYKCPKCGRGNFLKYEANCVYCGEPLIKTDCAWKGGE